MTCGPGTGVCFWKGNDSQPYSILESDSKVFVLAANPCGQTLAIGSEKGLIYLF